MSAAREQRWFLAESFKFCFMDVEIIKNEGSIFKVFNPINPRLFVS